MGGGAPLRRRQALPLPPEGGLLQGAEIGGVGGVLRDLLIRGTALQLGGRHLGGQDGLPLPRIGESQQVRVKRGALPRCLRLLPGADGPVPVVLTVMEKHLPGTVLSHIQPVDLRLRQGAERGGLRPAQQGQQHPLTQGPRLRHRLRQHRADGHRGQLPEPAGGVVHGIHQDELLLGPGHGHVEDALLLRQVLPPELLLDGLPGQCGILDLPLQVHPSGPKAQGGMHQHRRVEVLPGEGVVQVRQDDDGELQALGLVDAHEPHAGRGRRALCGRGLSLLQQAAQLGDEGEEAPIAAALEFFRVLAQGDQVLPPLRAAVHGPEDPQHVEPVVDVPDQAVDAHVPARQAQIRQDVQKGPAVLPAVGADRVVVVPRRGGGADLGQPVRREAEDGRAEDGDQGHVLPRVVHDLQQGHHDGDLHGVEEVAALLEGAGDVPLRQGAGEGLGPAAGRAHEDHDVLRPAGAEGAVPVGDGIALVQQLPDALRREPGLRQELLHRPVVLRRLLPGADQVELRLAVVPLRVVFRPEVERFVLTVVHLPHLPGEDVGEDKVCSVQDLPPGAEIP